MIRRSGRISRILFESTVIRRDIGIWRAERIGRGFSLGNEWTWRTDAKEESAGEGEDEVSLKNELVGMEDNRALLMLLQVDSLKALLKVYSSNPKLKENERVLCYFLHKLRRLLNKFSPKDRVIDSTETKKMVGLVVKDLGRMSLDFKPRTQVLGLLFLSRVFGDIGYKESDLYDSIGKLSNLIDKRLVNGEMDDDIKSQIVYMNTLSSLKYNFRNSLERLRVTLTTSDISLFENILDPFHIIQYFEAVSLDQKDHPALLPSLYLLQMKIADITGVMSALSFRLIDRFTTFQLAKAFKLIASSKQEVLSFNGQVVLL